MTVDRSPARLSAGLSVLVAGLAVAALETPPGPAVGAVGAFGIAVGAVTGSRRWVTVGAFAVFAGVAVAGYNEAPAEELLIGAVGSVIAWDLGEQAINVGEQLGRAANTRRAELAHFANTTLVGALAAGGGYAVFAAAGGGRPLSALVLLLVAAIALASAVRD